MTPPDGPPAAFPGIGNFHTQSLEGLAMARLDDLLVLRGQLLDWVEDAPVDRKAALVAQLRATLVEIEALSDDDKKGDQVDEIAQRRAARGAGTTQVPGRSEESR